MKILSVLVLAVGAFLVTHVSSATTTSYVLSVKPGEIVVRPAAGWHINEEFPWTARSTSGASKAFKTSPAIAAARDLSKDTYKVKGGVCNANSCVTLSFETQVP